MQRKFTSARALVIRCTSDLVPGGGTKTLVMWYRGYRNGAGGGTKLPIHCDTSKLNTNGLYFSSNNNIFSIQRVRTRRGAVTSVVESCKRLESSLLDCLGLLFVSYTLGLIVGRGIARARASLLRM